MCLELNVIVTSGIRVRIDWPNFPVGGSCFIPGADVDSIRQRVSLEVRLLKYKLSMLTVKEDGLMGVRVWRLE